MEGPIEMSQHERDVMKVMSTVLQGKRTLSGAARLLRLSEPIAVSLGRRSSNDAGRSFNSSAIRTE
jgi:hypothetical protein